MRKILYLAMTLILFASVAFAVPNHLEAEESTCENCIWSGTHLVCDPTDMLLIYSYVNEDCGTATPLTCFDFVFGWCDPV